MPGTREGALKAAETNKKNDPNFYANIGQRSWNNPERSHVTGFAKLPREKVAELGRKGGKKTKSEYKTQEETPENQWTTAEEIRALTEAEDGSPSISE